MFAAALGLLGAIQSGWAVTLTNPGARVPVILKDISRQVGRTLTADDVLSREVIAVRFQDVPVQQVLVRLAEAVGGEWIGNEICATRRITDRDDAERVLRRTRAMDEVLAKWKHEGVGQPIDEGELKRQTETVRTLLGKKSGAVEPALNAYFNTISDPKVLLARAVVQAIPVSSFCAQKPGERRVFSNIPTNSQELLNGRLEPGLQRFEHDWRLVERYVIPVFRGAVEPGSESDETPDFLPKPLPEDYKIDVAIRYELNSSSDLPNISVLLIDRNGIVLDSADPTASISPGHVGSYGAEPTETETLEPKANGIDEFQDFIGPSYRPNQKTPILARRFSDRLLDPVKYEPLALEGEQIVRFAKANNLNLVSDLPENMLDAASAPLSGFRSGEKLEQAGEWTRIDRGAGWLVLRPINFSDARGQRLDREAVKSFLQQVESKGGVFLEDAANYALSCPSDFLLGSWDRQYLSALLRTDGRFGVGPVAPAPNPQGLRLYGLMSPPIRARLPSGVTFGELDSAAQKYLIELCYETDEFAPLGQQMKEVTEILPNGPPQGAIIKFDAPRTTFLAVPVMQSNGATWPFSGPLGARSFANYEVHQKFADSPADQAVLAAQMRTMNLRAELAPKLSLFWPLTEMAYAPGPPTTFGELPEAYRTAVEKARAARVEQLRHPVAPIPEPPPPP